MEGHALKKDIAGFTNWSQGLVDEHDRTSPFDELEHFGIWFVPANCLARLGIAPAPVDFVDPLIVLRLIGTFPEISRIARSIYFDPQIVHEYPCR